MSIPEPQALIYKKRWQSGSGSIGWNGEGRLKISGSYVGASYQIVRAIHMDYGYHRKLKQTNVWEFSYTVLVDAKEMVARMRSRDRRRIRLGHRCWILLNDRDIYITAGKLSDLIRGRDQLHEEIALRIMLDQPVIDSEQIRRYG